ncbi:MAG: hypothetical protein GY765_33325, partial [bacterium]|nr:hypothetical protein [bacterium]
EKRGKVTGVIVEISYPDGTTKTITVDPKKTEAIFWSERAVKKIFAPFYDSKGYFEVVEEMNKTLPKAKKKDCPDRVLELWDVEDKNGMKPAFLGKSQECDPE